MSSLFVVYNSIINNSPNTTNAEFEFVSQYGLMLYNQMLNINKEGNSVSTIDKEQAIGIIDANEPEKDIVLNTAIINNYGETIKNLRKKR